MTKLPLETRPLRLAPDIARILEDRLRPFTGKKLEAAQQAILKVYRSGKQGDHGEWLKWYDEAIASVAKEPVTV